MASQVSHIVYAQKLFEEYPEQGFRNRDEFFLGCVFPDIRRIDGQVKRKDTHLKFDPLDLDFSGLTDFEAGWKFHLYSDMRREEILNAYNFYSLPYAEEFAGQSAKMLEDELVYGDFERWEKIVHLFNSPPVIENGIGVSRETFELWYAINAKYLEKKPDNQSFRIFFSKQPSLVEKAEKMIKIIDKLRKNGRVIELLKKVKEEIV